MSLPSWYMGIINIFLRKIKNIRESLLMSVMPLLNKKKNVLSKNISSAEMFIFHNKFEV